MHMTLTFPVDAEHGALRFTVLASFIGVWIVVYAILNALIYSQGINLIAIIVGFAGAALATSKLIEPALKKRWPSGRTLQIDERGARLLRDATVQTDIAAGAPLQVLRWRFAIKRGRNRVPKGWFVVACALEQDDNYLSVYALASPDDVKRLEEIARFTPLMTEKETQSKGGSLQLAGEQRRLRTAESHRWADGAEMSVADFEQFITQVQARFQS
jgi:hypothetical protein